MYQRQFVFVLREEAVQTVRHVLQRISGSIVAFGLAVAIIQTKTIQRITQSQNNVSCRCFSCLLFFFHLGQVLFSGFFCLLKDRVRVLEDCTRFVFQSLGGKSNTSIELIVVNDHTLDLHTRLQDSFQIFDTIVRNLRNVQETRHASNFHEGTIWLESLDKPLNDISAREISHLLLDNGLTVGNHQFVVFLRDFQKFQRQCLSDKVFVGKLTCQVRSRQECAKTLHQANGTTSVDSNDGGFQNFIGFCH
mmetsp:Transcript_25062/g.52097  ORF Transcript_25062/g.52097 Transcript_25062/m.52097 type:complete len:249 (-) Transcript_25062:656-1402(-)